MPESPGLHYTQNRAVSSGNQLLFPSGALGDFFGPGTTVGIPLATQIGVAPQLLTHFLNPCL